MCLSTIVDFYPMPKGDGYEVREGYKFFSAFPAEGCITGWYFDQHTPIVMDQWIEADRRKAEFVLTSDGVSYDPGFHLFETLSDAEAQRADGWEIILRIKYRRV